VEAEEEKRRLQAQLQHAQKLEAIGTLAGGIAHDFNNLLMGIQGNASLMLLDTDSEDPHYEKLKNIEQYIQNGAELTRQLLGFARGGKYEVKPTDINALVERTSTMFSRTKREIAVHSKYQQEVWVVEVDPGQMEQVLLNLYVNAWQAMPGGGDLFLETENIILGEDDVRPFDLHPGRYVRLSVGDNGTGMEENIRERIFDPFFTTKEMGRGTGLGLASVYGIVKNHGGFIQVHSQKGEGTTFDIYLPASEKQAVKEIESPEIFLGGTEGILLVDDEDMILQVGEELLERMGYGVFTAASGREAIDIYKKNSQKIDMVILDMIMPGMSGSDTFDCFKEMEPNIKVLLSSGYSLDGQATEILNRGCHGFIQKPFNIKELSKKIREVFD
jgi:nitrogen-specific signal transduction histidine kinase/CheY-like chemotaxis protein